MEKPKVRDYSGITATVGKFLERTSLPAVPVLRKTKSPWRKLLWFGFLILGFSMAILQARDLINEYKKYLTVITITERVDSLIPFPSITFCPNSPVRWKMIVNMSHPIYLDFIEALQPAQEWEQLLPQNRFIPYYKESIQTAMFKMKETERNEFLRKRTDYILFVNLPFSYRNVAEEELFLDTYIPFYGICSTFNPGLPGYKPIFVHTEDSITFYLFDDDKNKPPSFRNTGILVNLHSPETSPQLENGISFPFTGKHEIILTIDRTQINRLPVPYPSACVDPSDENRRKQNPYFTQQRPYLYTSKICLDKLHQDRAVMKKCILSKLPLPNSTRPVKICNEDLPNDRIGDLTDCPLTCSETIYDWKPQVMYSPINDSSIIDSASRLGVTEEELIDGLVRITFRMESGRYTVNDEQAKYTIGDLLGAIGGNLSLWIGLTVVSIFEVLDFVALLFLKLFKFSKTAQESTPPPTN